MGRTIRISMFLVAFLAVGCSVHERKAEPVRSAAVMDTVVWDTLRVTTGIHSTADSVFVVDRDGRSSSGVPLTRDTLRTHADARLLIASKDCIWAMRDGDRVATMFPPDQAGYDVAKEYVGGRGLIQVPSSCANVPLGHIGGGLVVIVNEGGAYRVHGGTPAAVPGLCTCGKAPRGRQAIDVPATFKWDSLTQVTTTPLSWRMEALRNKPKPGELHRADYAYDAGGVRERGESDGHFRIQDMQVTYQPAGPFGGVIPDTLLIVSPDRGAPVMPGRFTVVDTIFEQYDPPLNTLTMVDAAARTDTTLLVRPH